MTIIKHHITDIDIFIVVKTVAVEAFYQDFFMIVPEGKSIASIDDTNPLFSGMDGKMFYSGLL